MSQQLNAEIELLAQEYVKINARELEKLFVLELNKAKKLGQIPVRGDVSEFWKNVKDRIITKIVKNQVAVSATIGYAVSQVMAWAISMGWDISDLKIPIAIFVAIICQAVWEAMDDGINKKKK